MPDDAELKRLAEAATRGEWRARTGLRYVYSDNSAPHSSYVCEVAGAGARLANLRYIAAANPATILRLLRERDDAHAKIAELEAALRACVEGMQNWARDEDGLHYAAWDGYVEAHLALGLLTPTTEGSDASGGES